MLRISCIFVLYSFSDFEILYLDIMRYIGKEIKPYTYNLFTYQMYHILLGCK